jgi:hypothetical protein
VVRPMAGAHATEEDEAIAMGDGFS